MPFDTSTSQGIAPFAAYVCTDQGAELARTVLERSGMPDGAVHGGGLSGAARLCADVASAQIVLAEIGKIPVSMACECVTEMSASGVGVILLGEHTDIDTYRALRNAGALEYFTLPANADDILGIKPKGPAQTETASQPAPSPSIAVLGCKGGVGASLLAQNLAFHAASAKGAQLRTALLDADLQFGSQAIDLDRDGTAGLFEALNAPDRIDETFIRATMDHLNDGLALYSHQVRNGQDALSYETGLSQVIAPIRACFGAVITDLPRDVMMRHPELLAQFDAVALVIPSGFSGVNAATRLIERINAEAPGIRILPVLSDLRRDAALSPKVVGATIGRDIAATLPRSDAPLIRAHRAARPLIQCQPRGPYAKAVRTIWKAATADAPQKAQTKQRAMLKRMFG
ncbi:AAA family ATPase [Roseovarius nanhaiticus]|uniref:AAA family ATPase n=1 Tax=Roseovarius nanhaiticus TaxID=573024 RepID=UPI00249256C6|nr:hypothetical protein [Roseovarius nanhaiticus]